MSYKQTEQSRGKNNYILDEFTAALKTGDFLNDSLLGNAEKWAKLFQGVDNNQARKFFNDVKSLKQMAETQNVEWSVIKVRIRLFLARLAYSQKRPTARLSREFVELFNICLEKVLQDGEVDSLKSFAIFLEAVYAYYYANRGYANRK